MKRISVSAAVVAVMAIALGGCAGDSLCTGNDNQLKNEIATATNLVFVGCLGVLQIEGEPSMETPLQERVKLESCVGEEMQKITSLAQDKVRSGSVQPDDLGRVVFWDAMEFATANKGHRQVEFNAVPSNSTNSNNECASEDRSFFQRRHG